MEATLKQACCMLALFCCTSLTGALAQQPAKAKLPQDFIGRPSPQLSFSVYEKSGHLPVKRTTGSYRGKWLVLEFWTRYCSVCIKNMPKLQKLKEEFSGQANFLLIGLNDKKTGAGIQALYRRIASEEMLDLDIAFDTISFRAFAISTTPKAVIVSPEGIISAYTNGTELNSEKLRELFALGKSSLPVADQQFTAKPTRELLAQRTENGSTSLLYQWQPGEPSRQLIDLEKQRSADTLTARKVSLEKLYLLAYVGRSVWDHRDSLYKQFWRRPMIETSDSARFSSSLSYGTGLYSYELVRGDRILTSAETMARMQRDLKAWLPFSAAWQTRQMPAYQLVFNGAGPAQLKSSAREPGVETSLTMVRLRGQAMSKLIDAIQARQYVLIEDRTGIDFPVDLDLECNMLSLSSLQKALSAIGLGLVPVTRPIKVLVISGR